MPGEVPTENGEGIASGALADPNEAANALAALCTCGIGFGLGARNCPVGV
jgi:hypothetical protein